MKPKLQAMKNSTTRNLVALGIGVLLGTTLAAQAGDPGRKEVALQAAPTAREQLDKTVLRLEARTGLDLALHHEMVDLLRATPDLVAEIPGILLSGKASLDTSAALIRGLEEIGSPAAQEALIAIQSQGAQRHMDRLRAVMSLGAVEFPTEAAISGLWSAAGERLEPNSLDLSNTALLALGAAGSRLRGRKPEAYDALSARLVAELRGASDSPKRAMTLKAIGNLHDSRLGAVVSEHLFDTSAPVRASAAHSLGMLKDVAQRDLLAMLLPAEPRGAVRAAMTDALREMPADGLSLRTVNGMALNEPNPAARALMVKYLVAHLHEFEEARPTLLEMTATDPSNQVRILASYCLRH